MKTTSSKLLPALALFLLMALSFKAKAQTSPYPVFNSTACTYNLTWYVVNSACSAYCMPGTAVVINTTPPVNPSWTWSCPSACDLKVVINAVNGSPIAPIAVSVLGTNTAATGCGSGNVTVSATGISFY